MSITPKELRVAQDRADRAAERVAQLTADLANAHARIADVIALAADVESLKLDVAAVGADAIAAGLQLGDSSDWKSARRRLADAESNLADAEAMSDAWKSRAADLADSLHDAKNTLKAAEADLLEAQHDDACKQEAAAAQAFLAAGDEFYRQHCELAAAIDARIRLRNRIQGLPLHTGGGYPVELMLVAPEGATFPRDVLVRRPPQALKGVA